VGTLEAQDAAEAQDTAEAQHMAELQHMVELQESPGLTVVMQVQCVARMETLELAVWAPERSAAHVEWVVEEVAQAMALCPTWDAVRVSTFRRPPTSMWDVAAISMSSDLDEILHA